jgi:hypothetical protein
VGIPNIPGLGETQYLLPSGQLTSKLPASYTSSQTATVSGAESASQGGGGTSYLSSGGGSTVTGVQGTVGGVSAAGSTAAGAVTAGSGVAAGTSGNPFVDAAEWAANLLNLVPIVGPGIAAVLTDGVQAVAYMTHDLAYALDTAVSVFKPGQAWRFVFGALTVLLATMAFRAWTGKSMMPSAPAVIPV